MEQIRRARGRWLALVCAAFGLFACEKKADPEGATRSFFEQVANGQAAAAYVNAAFAFQAQQTETIFQASAKELGLTEYAAMQSEPAVIEGRTAKLRAEITTRNGRKFPLLVTLSEESGKWRVFSLKSPVNLETGVAENRFSLVGKGVGFTDAVAQPVPPPEVVDALTRETMLAFNDALARKSFEGFYNGVARAWQRELTVGQLTRAFAAFIERGVNLDGVRDLELTLAAPPAINSEGLLVVRGAYATRPLRVNFTFKFLYELPKWRLFGLDVNLVE